MKKKYNVRVYSTNPDIDDIIKLMVETGVLAVRNVFNGVGGVISIYDGEMSSNGIKLLISFGILYFPLNNYGDFKITCPYCNEPINDDMILTIYDDDLLRGFNIECYHDGCGKAIANVDFLLD